MAMMNLVMAVTRTMMRRISMLTMLILEIVMASTAAFVAIDDRGAANGKDADTQNVDGDRDGHDGYHDNNDDDFDYADEDDGDNDDDVLNNGNDR